MATPRSTRGQRALIGLALLLFVVASAYLALVIITRVDTIFSPYRQVTLPSKVGVLPLVDAEGTSGSMERVNILVLGLDGRARDGDTPSRTDTIFVVTVDPKTNSTGMLGIPRDLIVEIPGRYSGTYEDRINSVYVSGELNGYEQGGIELLKEVIADNFGIEIHKYVMVNFEGFEEIVDALGGIEVDVPEAVYDPYYSETELPGDFFPQDFEPGVQHMDGRTALAYSRIRFSSDDFDRIQRQQRVIFATIEKGKSLNLLKDAPSLWSKYKNTIETDISDVQIPSYAVLANRVKDNIHAVSLGPATAPYTTPEGAAVLIGDGEAIVRIVRSLFEDKPSTAPQASVTPDQVRVEVQNATNIDGLAARVVNYIVSRGLPLDDVNANNVFDLTEHEVSEIIDLEGNGLNSRNALLISKWLGIDPSRVRDATAAEREAMQATNADIVVILGSDFDFESATSSTGGG